MGDVDEAKAEQDLLLNGSAYMYWNGEDWARLDPKRIKVKQAHTYDDPTQEDWENLFDMTQAWLSMGALAGDDKIVERCEKFLKRRGIIK